MKISLMIYLVNTTPVVWSKRLQISCERKQDSGHLHRHRLKSSCKWGSFKLNLNVNAWHHRISTEAFHFFPPFKCIEFGCKAVYFWNSKVVLWIQNSSPSLQSVMSKCLDFNFRVNYPLIISYIWKLQVIMFCHYMLISAMENYKNATPLMSAS